MNALYVETPLWESRPLSGVLGVPVYLKMEALQPAGSFKARGMGAACRAAAEQGAQRVVCASGGNAGYAVAYAGRQLGLAVTIEPRGEGGALTIKYKDLDQLDAVLKKLGR